MATDFAFYVDDEPGSFSKIANILAEAGINIEGFSGTSLRGLGEGAEGRSIVRVLTDNAELTARTLRENDIIFETEDVVVINLLDTPGEFARFAEELAAAGVNTTGVYTTLEHTQVVASDNPVKVKTIAANLGCFSH